MFEENNQLQCWEQQIWKINWSFSDYFGSFEEVFRKKYQPWQCPQCLQRFRWDQQLRRHQIKMNHTNIDRIRRREKKYKKFEFYTCKRCQMKFKTHLERIQHYRWCQKDPRTEKTRESYRSTWHKVAFECKNHQIAHYFSTFEKLKEHLKTHRARNPRQHLRKNDRSPINLCQHEFEKEISSTQCLYKTPQTHELEQIQSQKEISMKSMRKQREKYLKSKNDVDN